MTIYDDNDVDVLVTGSTSSEIASIVAHFFLYSFQQLVFTLY